MSKMVSEEEVREYRVHQLGEEGADLMEALDEVSWAGDSVRHGEQQEYFCAVRRMREKVRKMYQKERGND